MRERTDIAPHPSEALLSAVASMGPVATRVPRRTWLVVLLGSLGCSSLAFVALHVRRDLQSLNLPLLLGVAALWLAAYAAALGVALLPPRNAVLPDPARATRVAVAISLALVLLTLLVPIEAPGHSRILQGAGPVTAHLFVCASIIFGIALAPLVSCLILARRLMPVGGRGIAAAAGAAGGALGGAVMQFICDVGGRLHATVGHGGAVILCALLGAALGRLLVGGPAAPRGP